MAVVVALAVVAVILVVRFEIFCLTDLARPGETRYLPRWAWAAVCLLSVPLGGVLYLLYGRPGRGG